MLSPCPFACRSPEPDCGTGLPGLRRYYCGTVCGCGETAIVLAWWRLALTENAIPRVCHTGLQYSASFDFADSYAAVPSDPDVQPLTSSALPVRPSGFL